MEEAVVMPQPSQEFCLRWNNYHSSLVSTLDSFKNDQVFVDVTIGCEGKYLGAHKMLLSACSVFFRDLIKVYPCPHPIIILPPDVRMSDMEKLLHFIYQGEVNVLQENLARFLKTAEMLKIKGLAEDSDKQKVLRTCTDGQESPSVSAGGGGAAAPAGNSSSEGSAASPKRPRLSLDTSSAAASSGSPASATAALTVTCSSSNSNNCSSNSNAAATAALLLDTPNTPNNTEDSTHSANESDSDMLPVKQEMVELKNCSEFETDGEPFNPDKYLAAAANAESGSSKHQPPPPPGPLLPSYVPPPPIKAQEDSPASGNASDELSQDYESYQDVKFVDEQHDTTTAPSFTSAGLYFDSLTYPVASSSSGGHDLSSAGDASYRRPAGPPSDDGYVTCPQCHKPITSYNLNRHIKMVHMTMDRAQCSLCHKMFKNKYSLSTHMHRQHHEFVQQHNNFSLRNIFSKSGPKSPGGSRPHLGSLYHKASPLPDALHSPSATGTRGAGPATAIASFNGEARSNGHNLQNVDVS